LEKYIVVYQTQTMFVFNDKKYNYWEIYEAIRRYYPIGIRRDETMMHTSYWNSKDHPNLILENIEKDERFRTWNDFADQTAIEMNKKAIGTTMGMEPAFSAYIELEKQSLDNLTRTKQVHFCVSTLGPFYTVIGEDKNEVAVGNYHYPSTNYFALSPINEYADTFTILCGKIENRFGGFRFIPYHIHQQKIEGLFINNWNEQETSSIFTALFTGNLRFTNVSTIGDEFYKSDQWIKEGYVDDGARWTSYPPDSRHPQ
jgi:hypothetical protein